MRLDIYRRTERGGVFSYLVVPAGKRLAQEVTNTDWESEARGFDFDEVKTELPDYSIVNPVQQIKTKGYAITSSQIRR